MDYTNDACKNIFTAGQRDRAQATLSIIRNNIWQAPNIIATGCDSTFISTPCTAVADFTSNGQTICVGNSVLFTNRSLNNCISYQWYFPGGTPSVSTSTNQIVTYSSVGTYPVTLVAININGSDSVTLSNYITVVTPPTGQALPFIEDFEAVLFPNNGITIDNPDAGITWERDTVAIQYGGIGSVKINNLVNVNYGQADALILPNFNLSSFSGTPYLSFRWAYAKSDVNYSDEMAVQLSVDCGVNFTQIFYRTGAAMTTGPTQTTPYIPDSNTVWKICNVSLANYATSDHAIIKIINVTDGGNNLYIDNINVGNSITLGIKDDFNSVNEVELYPNPSNGIFQLSSRSTQMTGMEIFNLLGEKIYSSAINHFSASFEIEIPAGIYFVKIYTKNSFSIEKLLIN